jgi:hypothetical protein
VDTGVVVHGVAPVTARQFAWFRIIFGSYLAIHFAHLVPWGAELFSREGVIPRASLNPTHGILPNVLAWADSPPFVTAFLVALVGLSVLFALGVARHAAALLVWYGWACLFNRNVLISNPSIAYVGLLLLLTTVVPSGEPLRAFGRRPERVDFHVPAGAYWTAWFLMAAGYAFSGIVKLASPSWVDGTAVWHVVQNPLARDGLLRDILLGMPAWGFRLLTWKVLALEILFLPLALWRWTRPVIWLAMVLAHIGILALVSFADLSAGMLMVHLFTVDSRWPGMLRLVRGRFVRSRSEAPAIRTSARAGT